MNNTANQAARRRKVRVDTRLCEGHALCIDSAPEVFDLGDDDVATCVETPPEAMWDKVQAAINSCPRQAISFVST
jgi:ferredoxin